MACLIRHKKKFYFALHIGDFYKQSFIFSIHKKKFSNSSLGGDFSK
nr:MAG TPA: hypothetical protein [Bacteriophage sp.]